MSAKELKNCSDSLQIARPPGAWSSCPRPMPCRCWAAFPACSCSAAATSAGPTSISAAWARTAGASPCWSTAGRRRWALYGCAVTHAFPLDNVERIEVIKGPASVLYGGEAMGGAVNIITRRPENKSESQLQLSYGSFNTSQLNLQQGGKNGHFRYLVTYDRRQSDGHLENSDYKGDALTARCRLGVGASPGAHPARQVLQRRQARARDGGTAVGRLLERLPPRRSGPFPGQHQGEETNGVCVSIAILASTSSPTAGIRPTLPMAPWPAGPRGASSQQCPAGRADDYRYFGGRSYNYPKGEWHKSEGSLFIHDDWLPSTALVASAGLRLQFDSLYGQRTLPSGRPSLARAPQACPRACRSARAFARRSSTNYTCSPRPTPTWSPSGPGTMRPGSTGRQRPRWSLQAKRIQDARQQPDRDPAQSQSRQSNTFFSTPAVSISTASRSACVPTPSIPWRWSSATPTWIPAPTPAAGPGTNGTASSACSRGHSTVQLQGQQVNTYFAGENSQKPIPAYFVLNGRLVGKFIRRIDFIVDLNNILDEEYVIYGEFPGISAGTFTMPGRNISIGLRWQK